MLITWQSRLKAHVQIGAFLGTDQEECRLEPWIKVHQMAVAKFCDHAHEQYL